VDSVNRRLSGAQRLRPVPDVGSEPPNSLEAEEALLGALLADHATACKALGELTDLLAPEDFYRHAHGAVFTALRTLEAQGDPIDAITVARELDRLGVLADAGGGPFLHTLLAAVPTPGHARQYAEIVIEHSRRRRLQDLGQQLITLAGELNRDPAGVARLTIRRVLDVTEPIAEPAQAQPSQGPVLGREALHGLTGDMVRTLGPHTEADPAGMALNFLAGFGNLVGAGPRALVGGRPHTARLNVLIVGETARSRKGTSWDAVGLLLEQVDRTWADKRIVSGLASGEGLVQAVRDEAKDTNGGLIDAGEPDKRLLVVEPEFARVLAVAGREGSTLSAMIRQAWDNTGRLEVLTKNNPLRASSSHISILGQVTKEELRRKLTDVEVANGFANRFLFAAVRRARLLPEGGALDPAALDYLADKVRAAAEQARTIGAMQRSADARELWRLVYEDVERETGATGLAAAVTARAAAQMLRLSVVYALLDRSPVVELEHLHAAHAVWRYCEASAQAIFGDALGDPVADQLLEALRSAGDQGMTADQQLKLFGRHQTGKRLEEARMLLEQANLARTVREETGGRPRLVTYARARAIVPGTRRADHGR
jgi:DnaB-like helicase N terminal domain